MKTMLLVGGRKTRFSCMSGQEEDDITGWRDEDRVATRGQDKDDIAGGQSEDDITAHGQDEDNIAERRDEDEVAMRKWARRR